MSDNEKLSALQSADNSEDNFAADKVKSEVDEYALSLSAFDEGGWLMLGKERAQTSVAPGMGERAAYIYGFMHGAREHREYIEANWPKVFQVTTESDLVSIRNKLDLSLKENERLQSERDEARALLEKAVPFIERIGLSNTGLYWLAKVEAMKGEK